MTWSNTVTVQPDETFDFDMIEKIKGDVPPEYHEDLRTVLSVVPTLDTWDPKKQRTVHLSGYHSETTRSIQVGVSGHKKPEA